MLNKVEVESVAYNFLAVCLLGSESSKTISHLALFWRNHEARVSYGHAIVVLDIGRLVEVVLKFRQADFTGGQWIRGGQRECLVISIGRQTSLQTKSIFGFLK